jgi:DNA helicase-2/ATP-dependent DNA helicase PcrA
VIGAGGRGRATAAPGAATETRALPSGGATHAITPPAPTNAHLLELAVGDDVRHATFGDGVILALSGQGDRAEAVVRFPDSGEKRLLLSMAPLEQL